MIVAGFLRFFFKRLSFKFTETPEPSLKFTQTPEPSLRNLMCGLMNQTSPYGSCGSQDPTVFSMSMSHETSGVPEEGGHVVKCGHYDFPGWQGAHFTRGDISLQASGGPKHKGSMYEGGAGCKFMSGLRFDTEG
jgi:hypothetical protein